MLHVIINSLAPVFAMLALGYYCGWRKVADNKNVAVLNVFVMRFALPTALFVATWHTPLDGLLGALPLVVVLVLSMWVLWFLVYFIARKVFKKAPAPASIYALTIALPNYAALGLPILSQALHGSNTGLTIAIAIACGAIFMSPLTLIVLEKETKEEYRNSSMLSLIVPLLFKAVKNPIVLFPIIGAILSAVGTQMPDLLTHALDPLKLSAGGGALFLTGLILSARRLKVTLAVIFGTILKNLIHPAIAFGVAFVLGFNPVVIASATYLAALATGFFGVMFGNGFGVSDEDSEGTLLLSTLLFALSLPLVIYLLSTWAPLA